MGRYRVGCTGWGYDDWRGGFYPPATPAGEYLERYARVFRVTEVDSTYYRIPQRAHVAWWAAVTPDGFTFSVKLPGEVTHEARLVDATEPFHRFLDAVEPLRAAGKLGPLVCQLPQSFTRTPEHARALESFLDRVPRGYRVAVELRHASWWVPETRAVLEAHAAPLVWSVNQYAVTPPWVTADVVYSRFIGDRAITRFDRVQRDQAHVLREWKRHFLDEGMSASEVYVLLNNHFMGFAPATARLMQEILGEEPADLTAAGRTGPQRALFDF